MTANLEFSTISKSEDIERFATILSQCFNESLSNAQKYLQRIGRENFRIVRQGGQIAGGLAIYNMGQWFGSQSVPIAGIASVGIAPEYRGTGAAALLMTETLKELHSKGIPLSTLYPATQVLYRKVGYEQGGSFCTWEMPLDSIRISDRTLPIQPVIPLEHEAFHQIYHEWAAKNNGLLNRHQAIWESIVKPPNQETVYAYLIGSTTQPQGYIIFSQQEEERIFIRDWAAISLQAGRRLWTAIADHRSQIKKVIWRSSVVDPFQLLLSEQTARIRSLDRWMVRVINVGLALEKRGYPQTIEAELHLKVSDSLLPENNGKFILSVSGGRGEITRGGRGDLQLDVRGLASLYTGLFTPHHLQLIDRLESTDEALNLATLIFAGPQPWLPDFF